MKIIKKISYLFLTIILSSPVFPSVSFAERLPDLPVTLKNGTGVISQNIIYIGLGSAGNSWYKLDLNKNKKEWEKLADFPGTARDQSIAIRLNHDIYIFGGVGKKNSDSETISSLTDIYRYSPNENKWENINSSTPYGLVGHTGVNISTNEAIIIGGVNKQIFDKYFIDLNKAKDNPSIKNKVTIDYFNQPIESYFFNRTILVYNSDNNQWKSLGTIPFNGTAGSSLVKTDNKITLINGELKPGLRTSEIKTALLKNNQLYWDTTVQKLPAPSPDQQQDGLAGAFAGYSAHTLLVAGGANFPGSQTKYSQNHYFAHQGLEKKWHKEIYGLINNQWKVIGELPIPLGYGVTIQHGNSLYLIGGETTKGEAVNSVITLTIKGKELIIN